MPLSALAAPRLAGGGPSARPHERPGGEGHEQDQALLAQGLQRFRHVRRGGSPAGGSPASVPGRRPGEGKFGRAAEGAEGAEVASCASRCTDSS